MVFKNIITSNNTIQDFYTVLYKKPLFYALIVFLQKWV